MRAPFLRAIKEFFHHPLPPFACICAQLSRIHVALYYEPEMRVHVVKVLGKNGIGLHRGRRQPLNVDAMGAADFQDLVYKRVRARKVTPVYEGDVINLINVGTLVVTRSIGGAAEQYFSISFFYPFRWSPFASSLLLLICGETVRPNVEAERHAADLFVTIAVVKTHRLQAPRQARPVVDDAAARMDSAAVAGVVQFCAAIGALPLDLKLLVCAQAYGIDFVATNVLDAHFVGLRFAFEADSEDGEGTVALATDRYIQAIAYAWLASVLLAGAVQGGPRVSLCLRLY